MARREHPLICKNELNFEWNRVMHLKTAFCARFEVFCFFKEIDANNFTRKLDYIKCEF